MHKNYITLYITCTLVYDKYSSSLGLLNLIAVWQCIIFTKNTDISYVSEIHKILEFMKYFL